jgi:hypothetical protein
VANWKWMLIGLALATIILMWIDGTIQSAHGYALIFGSYLAVWEASKELKGRTASPR